MYIVNEFVNQLNNKEFIYERIILKDIFQRYNINSSYYKNKYMSELDQLAFYLNNGLVKMTVISLSEHLIENNNLAHVPMEFITPYYNLFKPDVLSLEESNFCAHYLAWSWLNEEGEKNVEFRKGNISCISQSLKTYIKINSIKPSVILKMLIKDAKRVGFIPLFSDSWYLFLFEKTEGMQLYISELKNEKKQRSLTFLETDLKVFSNIKPLPELSLEGHKIGEYDLVTWMSENTIAKGIVRRVVPERTSVKKIYESFIINENNYFNPDLFENLFGMDLEPFPRLLVQQLNTNGDLTNNFYAIPTRETSYIIPYSPLSIKNFCIQILKDNNFDVRLNLDFDNKFGHNASYDPKNNTIYLVPPNLHGHVLFNYLNLGINVEQTLFMVLAHELGHLHESACKLPFTKEYRQRIDVINSMLHKLNKLGVLIQGSKIEQLTDIRKLYSILDNLLEVHTFLKKHYEFEQKAEFDAWYFGREIIPSQWLNQFNEENLFTYEGYISRNNKQLENFESMINRLENLIKCLEINKCSFYDYRKSTLKRQPSALLL